jgi:hypothetical protein
LAGVFNGWGWNGFIDEVKIFPYVRTPAQISAEYSAGLAGTSSSNSSTNIGSDPTGKSLSDGLIGYWKMDEGVGTSLVDSSGSNRNANFSAGSTYPTWTGGKYGPGLNFFNISNYIIYHSRNHFKW